MAAETNPAVVFVKVDVEVCEDMAEECGVSTLPTFQWWSGGAQRETFSGATERPLTATTATSR